MSEIENREKLQAYWQDILNKAGSSAREQIAVPAGKDAELIYITSCRTINGNVLIDVMNKQKVAGMIFTLQVTDMNWFRSRKWSSHSVGILELSNNLYIVYDQSNKDPDNDQSYFFRMGSLEELSGELNKSYYLDWNLSFTPSQNPQRSVAGRLQNSREMLSEQKTPVFTDITAGVKDSDDRTKESLLGLKYVQTALSGVNDRIREYFTFGYA